MSRSTIGSACAVSANPVPNFIASLLYRLRAVPRQTGGAASRAQHPCAALAAGVGAGLNQRSKTDGGIKRILLPRRGDEAVGILLQHQALAYARLAYPRHSCNVGRMAWVALRDRGTGVTARLALCLRPSKRHEAARVPPLFALGEAGLAQ